MISALTLLVVSLLALSKPHDLVAPVSPILYVSTLDGTFYALDASTGDLRWKIKEDKVVSVPDDFQENQKFFPDPLDGSLYALNRGNVEKLQHTIPEMVNSSPMRTRGGLLYAGKKTDYWVALNPNSGDKHASVTTNGVESCNAVSNEETENSLYVGKSEYSLTIVDSKTASQTWNVTYVSYVAPPLADLSHYQYTHYASSSDGTLLTFNTDANQLLWHKRLVSPVINVFVDRFGSLLRVPHRTLAADTIVSYMMQEIQSLISENQFKDKGVVNCLFIGKYSGGIYAMTEVMHSQDVREPRPRFPEIGSNEQNVMMIGRHVMPMLPDHLLISHLNDDTPRKQGKNTVPGPDSTFKEDPIQTYLVIAVGIIVVLVLAVIVIMMVLFAMITNLKNDSPTYPSNHIDHSTERNSKHTFTVGKIDVYLSDIIGHGSEGTVVFKGRFEKRAVAVKRVLLDFIDIDLHEVELLRQADEHPNVIRYFCMETDSMFRYLALEICQASLRQYVESTIFVKNNSQNKSLLYQTISGLKHLHSLNIVHRDIKPGNILISKCPKKANTLKALISDFGLCRKIVEGRQSLTARTGSAGTDGWIAPEMLLSSTKISCGVDIFSYGCIMYYVLSGGQHPFGNDVYRRQNNILNNDYDLSCLAEPTQDNVSAVSLIVNSVVSERDSRPTAEAIDMHPYFWNQGKQLRFFSDVSDRVEKEEGSELVLRWEHNCVGTVLRGGWINQCPELQQDLYKYRKYRSDSVRDLLRAMRNKRHHYRELPEELRATLGDIPDGYMDYFSSRFPRLLLHTYTIMRECGRETVFQPYYPETSTFREQRKDMPRYCSAVVSAGPDRSRLALDSTGQYSEGEVVRPLEDKRKAPKSANKRRGKQQTVKESSSWRRDSESSDTPKPPAEPSPLRSSQFRLESTENNPGKHRNADSNESLSSNKQIDPVEATSVSFKIPTTNKFDVISDKDDYNLPDSKENIPSSSPPPGFSENKPWFEKFEVQQPQSVIRRKHMKHVKAKD